MAFFKKQKSGGFMDEIRCDEPTYLIWKWHPYGSQPGNNNRENAIRWGSSLRVKDGEVAVFVYHQADGVVQDFIEGPYDQMLETENLPVLANLIGLAYNGGTPFQAEVYFINLAKVIQVPFAVPYFDLYDPRFEDFGVPTAVRGMLTFHITDYRKFIYLHRLASFDLFAFQTQIRDAVARYVKGIVANAPAEKNLPVVQIEREIPRINELVEMNIRERFERDFGVTVMAIDIRTIEIDKTSSGYIQLKRVTQDITTATVKAQADVDIRNMQDMQRINAENTKETMRIQREETQYAQRKQTESTNYAAYQTEKHADVGIAGAQALGKMGSSGAAGMFGNGGVNPVGLMAGMAMGSAVGQNVAGIMNGMMGGFQQQAPGAIPPPIPQPEYYVAVGQQPTGPFGLPVLQQMSQTGRLTKESLVWKTGMPRWEIAAAVAELQKLFENDVPPIQVPPVQV